MDRTVRLAGEYLVGWRLVGKLVGNMGMGGVPGAKRNVTTHKVEGCGAGEFI